MFIYDFDNKNLKGFNVNTLRGVDAGEGMASTTRIFAAEFRSDVFISYRIDGNVDMLCV